MRESIIVEGLGKKYSLIPKSSTNTFWGDLYKYAQNSIRKSGLTKAGEESFWALKDISFSVEEGEVLGVIGDNGSGKSTLLKVLAQITEPTIGTLKIKGNISSILEVGAGFHPDLSGIENVYLSGCYLGMTRQEVKIKLDEIIAFSGIEDFVHLPVKKLSSGMAIRIAFSVAAHLNSNILLLDEIFTVGDINFQKKCLDKMRSIISSGRTIIYVSHDLESIKEFCSKCLYLNKGSLITIGTVDSTIKSYLSESEFLPINKELKGRLNHSYISSIKFISEKTAPLYTSEETIKVEISFYVKELFSDIDLNISLFLNNQKVFLVFGSELTKESFTIGKNTVFLKIPAGTLNAGRYYFNIVLHRKNIEIFDIKKNLIYFKIISNHPKFENFSVKDPGIINLKLKNEDDYFR